MQKKCEVCRRLFGENYYPSRLKKQKYCSYECRDKAHENKEKKICERCGKEFYIKKCWSKRGGGRFCSLQCHNESMTVHGKISCKTCGKELNSNDYIGDHYGICEDGCDE